MATNDNTGKTMTPAEYFAEAQRRQGERLHVTGSIIDRWLADPDPKKKIQSASFDIAFPGGTRRISVRKESHDQFKKGDMITAICEIKRDREGNSYFVAETVSLFSL